MRFKTAVFAGVMLAQSLASCTKRAPEAPNPTDTTSTVGIIPAPAMQYPSAKLVIIEPREGQVIKNSDDSVRIVMQLGGAALGEHTDADSTRGIAYAKQGQHIHVIVDDKPYMADFLNGQPFNVGILPPGLHTIRAFPAFSWHESIKSPSSFATRTFYIGRESKEKTTQENNLEGPLLTYSRPKGTYSGNEAKKILLDFYVSNAKLASDGYHVKLWIDGKPLPDIIDWHAYFIEGLSTGNHTIKLQLTAPDGSVVPGSYNSPSETITVQ